MFARVLIGLVALGMTATMAPAAWADPTPEPEPSQSAVAEPDDGTQTPPPETPAVDDPVLGEPEPVVGTAAGWADRQGDAVWGTIKLYQASVDTWAELKEALDSVGAYSSVPYVILINDSFTMGDMYTLTNKNVVL
ncbi:MAG: hypothetical protein LBR58_11130, partial [Propionibacteriaceae bacterium]|nr:hypothetical protein [Propionibacteriaceae bacterium]